LRMHHQVNMKTSSITTTQSLSQVLTSMIRSGLKDERQDIFKLWKIVFSSREAASAVAAHEKNRTSIVGTSAGSGFSSSKPLTMSEIKVSRNISGQTKGGNLPVVSKATSHVTKCVQGFGDNQLVLGGIFENILLNRINDPTGTKVYAAAEWMSFGMMIDDLCYSSDSGFALAKYLPSVAGAIHLYVSSESMRPHTSWPTRDREMRYRRQERESVVRCLLDGSGSHTFNGRRSTALEGRNHIVLDSVTALSEIIAPRIRAVPVVSLNPQEQASLANTVEIMKSLGLNYQLSAGTEKPQKQNTHAHLKFSKQESGPQLEPCLLFLADYTDSNRLASRRDGSKQGKGMKKGITMSGINRDGAYYTNKSRSRGQLMQAASLKVEPRSRILEESVSMDPLASWIPVDVRTNIFLALREARLKSIVRTPSESDGKKMKEDVNTNQTTNKVEQDEKMKEIRKEKENVEMKSAIKVTANAEVENRMKKGRMDFFCRSSSSNSDGGRRKDVSASGCGTGSKRKTLGLSNGNLAEHETEYEMSTMSATKKAKVVFKFNQGFSNAVRRPVSINDFL